MGYFRNPEHEPVRVQKLNTLEQRVSTVEEDNAVLDLDGGSAATTSAPVVDVDGGGA